MQVPIGKKEEKRQHEVMPVDISLLPYSDFVAEKHLGRCAFPAPVPGRRNHVPARRIDIQLRHDSCAMARDDQKGDR